MSDRQRELAARRGALRAKSAIQREFLVDTIDDIETRLTGLDRGIDMVRHVVKQPVVLAGGIALIALIGPRRVLRMAGRAAVLFATGRRVLRIVGNR